MDDRGKSQNRRTQAIVLGSILVIALAVWFGGRAQQRASERGADELIQSQQLLTGRLDMETALRGFLLTGRIGFLEPYQEGSERFETAFEAALADVDGDREDALLAEQRALTDRWTALAETGIEERRGGTQPASGDLVARKLLMDRFRRVNTEYTGVLREQSEARERTALLLVIAIIVAIGLAGLAIGYFVIQRPAARARVRRRGQSEFQEMLQFADSEREANDLVRRQLERALPGSRATVMSINNSENRLQAATDLEDDPELAGRLRAATPSSCLAVRRGKAFRRSQVDEPLVACQICGKSDASTLCSPTLVGGEIIGSVLIRSGRDSISDRATADVQQTVASAAPVLANLRNLAVAETRAVTDSLTGLANSRAATETLSVMAAYAARSGQPLSAILADLDHFKQVNDNYGHPIGDEVLAAAAESFRNSVRSSDFVARYGGEEFLVLLQGTDKQSAAEVAEKMRRALAYLRVPGFAARATASFGIATIPDDAAEPDGLLRAADEALYSSKENGRDRVTVYREPAESDPRAAAKSR